ncbi:LapA family protein [Salipiger sp. IMCC34102]|uniref:LapA family protein n=1 Tax=Salipiger sp. IMCC34102 TaxID=2510647 RepID=UPI00101B61A9|nr:LapA family protein [Salipiger sp. IMCC34102]RYH01882.1 LapA family protein [Salipiger sp. IMCC34102]
MHTLKYVFWAIVAFVLILVGLANRDATTLQAMPDPFANLLGISPNVTLPLFVVLFVFLGIGLLIGLVWEWLREYPERVESRRREKELERLRDELARLRATSGDQKTGDDVIALLDQPRRVG